MTFKAIAFSEKGMALGGRIEKAVEGFAERTEDVSFSLTRCASGGLAAWTEEAWASSDALIFIGSCGIAVRAIAPFVKKKTEDPAVVVIDELGTYSIPVLSGHLGGANELAVTLAEKYYLTTANELKEAAAQAMGAVEG